MSYPVGKPAHNRLTEERLREECLSRNHTLLEFKHPTLKVRCHCGNEYEQKIHSYRAAKNSCKKCDRQRKSKPRPEHSRLMRENNPFKGKKHKPGIFSNRINSWKPTQEQREWPGELYLVRYLDDTGTHFKLGITYRGVQKRLGNKLISILHIYYATLGECFDLEQSLLKWAKSQGYRYSSPTTTELLYPEAIPHVLSELSSQQQCTSKSPASPSSSGACS